MLYETVELLYAFVNDIPAERLTAEGTYCIPEGELAGIMGAVCANLDPQDPDLHRYFARRPILDEPNQYTCLAFCMVYALVDMHALDIPSQIEAMCARWERMRRVPLSSGDQPLHHRCVQTPGGKVCFFGGGAEKAPY